jgi:hypothetical protein
MKDSVEQPVGRNALTPSRLPRGVTYGVILALVCAAGLAALWPRGALGRAQRRLEALSRAVGPWRGTPGRLSAFGHAPFSSSDRVVTRHRRSPDVLSALADIHQDLATTGSRHAAAVAALVEDRLDDAVSMLEVAAAEADDAAAWSDLSGPARPHCRSPT